MALPSGGVGAEPSRHSDEEAEQADEADVDTDVCTEGPPPEAVPQPDGGFLVELPDGSTLRWGPKRPDGTWRRPERRKAGWVGDLERNRYSPPGARSGGDGGPDSAATPEAPEDGLDAAAGAGGSASDATAPPVPGGEVQAADRPKHELHHAWWVWVHQRSGARDGQAWGEGQQKLHKFDTVEDFWCMFNHSYPPSRLENADYSLFKDGMTPAWEDPNFKNGGRWVVKLEKVKAQSLDDLWLSLCMALIGEAFADYGPEMVCGAIVSVRNRVSKISLWLSKGGNKEQVMAIGRAYRDVLAGTPGLKDLATREVSFEDFGKETVTMQLPRPREKDSTAGLFQ